MNKHSTDPRRVLINFLGRSASGPVFTLEMAKGFLENGYEVYAVLSHDIDNRREWMDEFGESRLYFVKTNRGKKDLIQKTLHFFFLSLPAIRKKFNGIEFALCIRPFYHRWAELVDHAVKCRKTATICHDPIPHSNVTKTKAWFYRRHIRASDDVIVLTRSFIPIVCGRYGFSKENVRYMPHGRMPVHKCETSIENTVHYEEKKANFLFFGRILGYKGLGTLAEAYRTIRDKRADVSLTVAGSGNFAPYSMQYGDLPDCVVDNKYTPDDLVGAYFQIPNAVTVLPYLDATQSGVIPIAMEYGCPVIASRTGGLWEQLDDGRMGLFFEAGDSEGLAKVMSEIAENPHIFDREREKMERFLERIEWKEIVSGLLDQWIENTENEA